MSRWFGTLSAALMCHVALAQEVSPVARFHHVHLNTTDVQGSIDFYTRRFKAERKKFVDGQDAIWTGGNWILFTQVAAPPKAALVTPLWHFGWGAPDMQSEVERHLAMGSKFQTPITNLSRVVGNQWRSIYYAYVESLDGALIEINTARDEEFSHVHLFTHDVAATSAWYQKHLGLHIPAERPGGLNARNQTNGEINWLIMSVDFIKRIETRDWKDRQNFESSRGYAFDHIGFSVDNLDATLARLAQEGVEISSGPTVVVPGKLRTAFIVGPEGVAIELVEHR
jgi:catechol 2,3-dioxygenase-like lactoylglutathione lyase family enzyme